MKIQRRKHKILTQIPGELEDAVKDRYKQILTLDYIANTLKDVRIRKNIRKYCLYKGNSFRKKQPFSDGNKDKTRERVAEVTKKKNSCHNCGSAYHYANNCQKEKKKVYAIDKVPEEEIQAEDSESDSMGYSNRESSNDDQDPGEETQLKIQEKNLEAGLPQETEIENLCKQTQDSHTFLVTPTKGMEYIYRTET
ncbi:hypothetical protein O181_029561 [Austropuccinia psidii MF-1]|uniref:Uncharacterized protein n=1 Tax=Austropuccinia psidii MF-1 TaxID=1389203 RepID=A0A9Q3CWR1_9BASI|nr:hypothetical protein [Austropuccinia psidii MF-1]